MLTFFTTAKPFRGHNGVIQRNALASWKSLHPDVEVILFGDDEGAAEVCGELGLIHEPFVKRRESGLKYLNYMVARAQEIARHAVFCYANCDIVFTADLVDAVNRVRAACPTFLMVGRRWDTEVNEPIDFKARNWMHDLRTHALKTGRQRDHGWIDYFVFSRGVYGADFPALAVGRVFWDCWMVWKALDNGHMVVDVSSVVLAIHQNHDYRYHPQGKQGVWNDAEAQRNLAEAGGPGHLRAVGDATLVLHRNGLSKNKKRHWVSFARSAGNLRRSLICNYWHPVWFFVLDLSRPVRTALGLRRKSAGN